MEVILKEDVAKLGSRGDVLKVADGYGRNYLLPKKLAIEATQQNKAVIDQMKAAAVRRAAKEKSGAEDFAKQLSGVSVTFVRRAGEHDQLFGSVTSGDIATELAKQGFEMTAQDRSGTSAKNYRRVCGCRPSPQRGAGQHKGSDREGSHARGHGSGGTG